MKKANRAIRDTAGFIILIIMLVSASALSIPWFFQTKTEHDSVNINTLPHTIDGWEGVDYKLTEGEYKILETRNIVFREYRHPSKGSIYLFIVYSETNRAVFHPPEVCLMGAGSTMVSKDPLKVESGKMSLMVNKLVLRKDDAKQIVLYCYKAGPLYTDNFYLQQLYLAFNQVSARRIPGATIRVAMAINGSEQVTVAKLRSFLGQTITILDKLSKN